MLAATMLNWTIVLVGYQAGGAPSSEPNMDLEALIQNVAASEALYASLDVRFTKSYQYNQKESKELLDPNLILSSKEDHRVVLQGDLFLTERDESMRLAGGSASKDQHAISSFDGGRTLAIEQKIANIYNSRVLSQSVFRPHTLLLTRAHVTFPLSDYLRGSPALDKYKYFRGFDVQVRLIGRDRVDDIDCLKVQVTTNPRQIQASKSNTEIRLLWIATERNYVPVRTEYYLPGERDIPLEVGKATDFWEVAQRIYYPRAAAIEVNDEQLLRQGKTSVSNSESYQFREFVLDPHHPLEFFKDAVSIPDGMPVYEIINGKIVKSYKAGAANGQGVPRSSPAGMP